METCYKLFRADIIKQLYLKECRFGFEPEVTAKYQGLKIFEYTKWVYPIMDAHTRKVKKLDGKTV